MICATSPIGCHPTPGSVAWRPFEMPNKLVEKSNDPVAEARVLIRAVAWPGMEPGESRKQAIGRAARRLGLRFSRARAVWYGLCRRIDAWEIDALRREARYAQRVMRRLADAEADAMGADSRQLRLDLDGGAAAGPAPPAARADR
jgi:hypothetical protein